MYNEKEIEKEIFHCKEPAHCIAKHGNNLASLQESLENFISIYEKNKDVLLT